MPKKGMKKIQPRSMPQKAPSRAAAPVSWVMCCVFGFFAPAGQLTMAASTNSISCCLLSLASSSRAFWAPSGVSNFHTVRVAIGSTPLRLGRVGSRLLLQHRLGLHQVGDLLCSPGHEKDV